MLRRRKVIPDTIPVSGSYVDCPYDHQRIHILVCKLTCRNKNRHKCVERKNLPRMRIAKTED